MHIHQSTRPIFSMLIMIELLQEFMKSTYIFYYLFLSVYIFKQKQCFRQHAMCEMAELSTDSLDRLHSTEMLLGGSMSVKPTH